MQFGYLKRREFIAALGAAPALWPLGVKAQQGRMRRVGVLSGFPNDAEGQLRVRAFKEKLQTLGWLDGRNLQLDVRWVSGEPNRIASIAGEMIAAAPVAILAMTTPALVALQKQTRTIPIVFGNVSDPVDGGFVTNLARPGGNVTGFTSFEYSASAGSPRRSSSARHSPAAHRGERQAGVGARNV